METLLNKFIKELKYKISLKMIPNKTEDQILYQNFKFFDLEGNGFCNLRDFMRTMEKVGVVMNKVTDLQDIFNYFDEEQSGVIDYKTFCKEIFQMEIQRPKTSSYKNQNNNNRDRDNYSYTPSNLDNQKKNVAKKSFFDKLIRLLDESGKGYSLIQLHKQFKLSDFNNTNKLTIDDFIKIISDARINLSISEIQNLFHCYEINNNGIFFYEEMFNDLKNAFWNDIKQKYIEDLINQINEKNNNLTVNDLRNMFKGNFNMKFLYDLGIDDPDSYFQNIIESFLVIKRLNRGNFKLNNLDLIDFFKYIAFGYDNDDEYFDLLEASVNLNNVNSGNYDRQNNNYNRPKTPTYKNENANFNNNQNYNNNNNQRLKSANLSANKNLSNNKIQQDGIVDNLRKSLKKFGLKSFFGLMKHFKYYDNGTKMITKYDFAKVLKDFRLNLTVSEIERIFDAFCTDPKKVQLNYEVFINKLVSGFTNDYRMDFICEIYDKLNTYSKKIGEKTTIDLIKSLYWAKNNFFGLDETQALNEFCDNLEIFHYAIKNLREANITKDEFCDFYKMISFLIDNDNDFINMVENEWKKVINEEPLNNMNTFPRNSNQNYNNQNQNFKNQNFNNLNEEKQFNNTQKRPINRGNNDFYNNDNENENYKREYDKLKQNLTETKSISNYNRDRSNSINTKDAKTVYSRPRSKTPGRNSPIKNIRDPMSKIIQKLRNRGIRGLMNLHKQFLFSCPNLSTISFRDFVKVLTLQRLDLSKDEIEFFFEKFSTDNKGEYLNFPNFIRAFKKVLNDNRLNAVEKAYGSLDKEQTENLLIDDIKLKFNPKRHHDVLKGIKNEDEIITEFLDCFELNYNLLTTAENPETSNMVSFEEFANFYEYVSFLYDNDNDFISLVENSWK